jgi:hypothetical protein
MGSTFIQEDEAAICRIWHRSFGPPPARNSALSRKLKICTPRIGRLYEAIECHVWILTSGSSKACGSSQKCDVFL